MAFVVNERDRTLQSAAERTVPVEDPGAIVIPGYTGLTVSVDQSLWVITPADSPYWAVPTGSAAAAGRSVLTVQFKGIPANTPVVWEEGQNVQTYDGPNLPPYRFVLQDTTLILTDTPDPLIKLILRDSYLKSSHPTRIVPSGFVRVRCDYAGQTFFSEPVKIGTFTG